MRKLIQFLTKHAYVAIGATVAVAVVGVAVAYFTTTGTGTGEGKVGSATKLTITATSVSELYPGTTSKIKFEVENTSPGHEFVKEVTLKEVKAYKDVEHKEVIAGCENGWFKMVAVTEGQDVPHGKTTLTKEGELELKNESVNQDACEKAYLVATFESN